MYSPKISDNWPEQQAPLARPQSLEFVVEAVDYSFSRLGPKVVSLDLLAQVGDRFSQLFHRSRIPGTRGDRLPCYVLRIFGAARSA